MVSNEAYIEVKSPWNDIPFSSNCSHPGGFTVDLLSRTGFLVARQDNLLFRQPRGCFQTRNSLGDYGE